MLILSRKAGEDITIGHDASITVRVVEIRGDKVRLGIQASREVPVHRREIYERIQENAMHNAATGPDLSTAATKVKKPRLPLNQIVAANIQRLLEQQGKSRQWLSEKTGLSEHSLMSMHHGGGDYGMSVLDRIAEAFGVESYELAEVQG